MQENELRDTLNEIERTACRSGLYEFFLSFWDVVSKEELHLNWHIKYLCDNLQELSTYIVERKPKPYDQIINIPPGTTKSTITTIMWPVWLWLQDPSIRIITNSHADSLAIEHATKSKDIIKSVKFKVLFPDIQLRHDKSAKGFYENTKTGARITTSTGSSTVGMHAHLIINDDPSDPKKVFSEPLRLQVEEKIKELSTRKIDKKNTITVTIMQRLHEQDATGYILETDKNINHICLPAELSKYVKPAYLKDYYKKGLLDPVRQSESVLEDAKRELGGSRYSGQYDQMPTAKGGNIIKNDWFRTISFAQFMSKKGSMPIIFFGDTAYTDKKENDPSGFIATCKIDNTLYITNAISVRKKFPDLIRFLPLYLSQNFYNKKSSLRIEPKASGISTIDELRDKTSINITEIKSSLVQNSKTERLHISSPTVESLRVVLIEGDWNDEFVEQVCGFPNKKHDEYVDLLSYAIDYHFNSNIQNNAETRKKLQRLLN